MTSLSGKTCLFDTNILVALINKKHTNHIKAVSLFKRLAKGEFKAVVSAQNLFELTAVLVHGFKQPRGEVAKDIKVLSQDKLLEIIYPDFRVLNKFIEFLKVKSNLHIADLYLIATAAAFGIEVLISADEDFDTFKATTVTIYNPFKV